MKRDFVAYLIVGILIVAAYLAIVFVEEKRGLVANALLANIAEQATSAPKIWFSSSKVLQGEPLMIQVDGLSPTMIREIKFGGKKIETFLYKNKTTAILGVDLSDRAGDYPVVVVLKDGSKIFATSTVTVRVKKQEPLGIPQKLGGNTATSQKNLVTNLSKENALIKSVVSTSTVYWTSAFRYPVVDSVVTDTFGYSRLTGVYTITHLGTDFHADEGTNVYAMNSGVIKIARSTTIYGNMILIDHGLGIESMYAHLSRINVKEGQRVEIGSVIGLSGQTGYAERPHLHVSIKINNISVDPIKFLNLFK